MTSPTDRQPPAHTVVVDDAFINFRGSLKLAGVLDIGTHASLVRLENGQYIFLDAYALTDDQRRYANELTDGGERLSAIVNLHPFHTLHVEAMHAMFPRAKLYGTERHRRLFPGLPWQPEVSEGPELRALFRDDFDFTVPSGVAFVPEDERLHFASVLALHRRSQALHVDDTLLYLRFPRPLRWLKADTLRLHPTLAKTLEPRAGAAAEFRAWCQELVGMAERSKHLCAAHNAVLRADDSGTSLAARVSAAVRGADSVVESHARRFS